MTWKSLIASLVLCVACASEEDPILAPSADGGIAEGGANNSNNPINNNSDGGNRTTGCGMLDLLFVIDNSGSMSEEQQSLAQNFPRVITVLDALKGGTVSYRIGVTTTSAGVAIPFFPMATASGALLQTSDMPNPWLERGEPNLSARFTKLATVGTSGSALEQPLAAARDALTTAAMGAQGMFRRPNALLAIVILTDEDDGSMQPGGILGFGMDAPVKSFIDTFDMVTGARGNWATAVIAGDREGGCESAFGEATYAQRLKDFVGQTGSNAVLGSICSGDLAGELDKALNVFTNACQSFVPLF